MPILKPDTLTVKRFCRLSATRRSQIRHIFFNGEKKAAFACFRRCDRQNSAYPAELRRLAVASTSPANAPRKRAV